jgi:hypothetical protein
LGVKTGRARREAMWAREIGKSRRLGRWVARAPEGQRAQEGGQERDRARQWVLNTRVPAEEASNPELDAVRGGDEGRGEEDAAVGPLKLGSRVAGGSEKFRSSPAAVWG